MSEGTAVPIVVSHSEVEAYLDCRKRHFYAFGANGTGLEPLPKDKMNALERGTLGHSGMDAFFTALREGVSYDGAIESAMTHIGMVGMTRQPADFECISLLSRIIRGFLESSRERISKWQIVHIEQEFRLLIPGTDVEYPFKPDLIVRENGILTVFDYKFAADFYSDTQLAVYPQLPKYVGALRALGIDVRRAAYIFIRTRANLKADTPADDRARIVQLDLIQRRVEVSWYEQINTTLEIAQYKQLSLEEWDKRSTRATSDHCKWCSFKELCAADLQGSNIDAMKRNDFRANSYGYSKKKESTNV